MTPQAFIVAYNRVLLAAGETPYQRNGTTKVGEKKGPLGGRQAVLAPQWDLKGAEIYLEWCALRGVDPLLFARARVEAARRRVHVSRMASEKFLAKFRHFGEDKQAKNSLQHRVAEAVVDDNDGTVFPRGFWELYKAKNTDREVCALSADVNGGWHPRSKHCRECPQAGACRDLLPTHVREARERVGG